MPGEAPGRIYVVKSIGGNATSVPPLSLNGSTPSAQQATAEVNAMVNSLQNEFNLDNSGSLSPLWNTLFWSLIAMAAIVVLHMVLRAIAVGRKAKIPEFLHWPRMELILLTMLVPIIAASAACEWIKCLEALFS